MNHQFAALHKRVQECGSARALETAGKQPVLPTDRDEAELVLGAVVVDGQAAILDVALERRPKCPAVRYAESDGLRVNSSESLQFSR